jgi:hypothetical protein
MYGWATMNCKASHLENYSYPGGGAENLVAPNTLLIEQEPRWWGSSFTVQAADDVGLALGASTGAWFRTWGPLWWTYVYQDDLGQETFMARDRPLALGGSHKIMRCDGTGSTYVLTEGTHVFMNRIRDMFGMYTSRIYNIYEDGKLIAVSEKIGGAGQSHKQLIFRDPKVATPFASSFLQERHYHGMFDKWFVHDEPDIAIPAWVINSGTMMMAFPTAAAKQAKAASSKPASFMELPPVVGVETAAAEKDANLAAEAAVAGTEAKRMEAKDHADDLRTKPSVEDAAMEEQHV